MRVLGEILHPNCKITIMFWNEKYIVKFEQGRCEQTFKVSATEVPNETDLRAKLSESFIQKTLARFESMQPDLVEIEKF